MVEKLQAAGAIIAGKTNLDEFGMGYLESRTLRCQGSLTLLSLALTLLFPASSQCIIQTVIVLIHYLPAEVLVVAQWL